MEARQERGLQIAALSKIERNCLGWKVPSQSGNGTYIVNLNHSEPFCTCPDFQARHQACKHIYAKAKPVGPAKSHARIRGQSQILW